MYNVSEMKLELDNAVAAVEAKIKAQFVEAFKTIYIDGKVPKKIANGLPKVNKVSIKKSSDLDNIYHGRGFYIILSNRAVEGNVCSLTDGNLVAIYRGECGNVRRRIQSHLFNSQYNSAFETRSSNYKSKPNNNGKLFYENHWANCLKLEAKGPSGIDVDNAIHIKSEWVVIVHQMPGSSQRVRELAELAFDVAFGHPAASRDTK